MPNLEDVVWCQEEPRNNGGWFFVAADRGSPDRRRRKVTRPRYAGRVASASPATGLAKRHAAEQAR
jgi:2-oxoglutarate dehydrogenase E1 component